MKSGGFLKWYSGHCQWNASRNLQQVASPRTLRRHPSHQPSDVPGVCVHIYTHMRTHAHAQAPGNHGGHFPPIVDLTIDLWNPAHFISFQIGSRLPINAKSHSVEGWQGTMDTLLSMTKRKLWLQRTGPQKWMLRLYCSDQTTLRDRFSLHRLSSCDEMFSSESCLTLRLVI